MRSKRCGKCLRQAQHDFVFRSEKNLTGCGLCWIDLWDIALISLCERHGIDYPRPLDPLRELYEDREQQLPEAREAF